LHQVVESREKRSVVDTISWYLGLLPLDVEKQLGETIAIIRREKAVAEQDAQGLEEKLKELGLETVFETEKDDLRLWFERTKKEMLDDVERKMRP